MNQRDRSRAATEGMESKTHIRGVNDDGEVMSDNRIRGEAGIESLESVSERNGEVVKQSNYESVLIAACSLETHAVSGRSYLMRQVMLLE